VTGATAACVDVELLRVVAEPVRAAIVAALAAEQMCTCHLVELTGAAQSNVSNHLRVLREAGVVDTEPVGRFTYYRLRPQVLEALALQFHTVADTAAATLAQGRRRPC
jgi:ArsR family transcriptional regulator